VHNDVVVGRLGHLDPSKRSIIRAEDHRVGGVLASRAARPTADRGNEGSNQGFHRAASSAIEQAYDNIGCRVPDSALRRRRLFHAHVKSARAQCVHESVVFLRKLGELPFAHRSYNNSA
jgi:hypothetical protein